jgi:O-antigen/teichoic acid export membrane protein
MGLSLRPYQYFKSRINEGHTRSILAKKNILASIFIKGASIAISLILVPLTIHYVNASSYGIWLTLSSIIGWFSFFDVGLTHGLRNRFAEAKAKEDFSLAQVYVSTTYAILLIIFSITWIIFLIANQFLNWPKILNIPVYMQQEISTLAIIVFSYFCLQFVLKVVSTILIASQQPAKSSLIDLSSQVISLIIVFILVKTTEGSLIKLWIALCASPILVLLFANIFLFKGAFKQYKPILSKVKFSYGKQLFNLGIKFFVIQIAVIIQYESTLFLIAHYYTTSQVTSYNIAYKYFGVLQMGFMILIGPFWSGVTDAYNSGDISWIRNTVKKYLLILIAFILAGFIMLFFATTIYNLWIGKGIVYVSFSISLLCLIFFSTGMFASIFVFAMNGIGALKIQFFSSLLSSAVFFTLSLVLIKHFHIGVEAILISAILSNFYGYIVAPFQYYQIFIKRSTAAIWYK